jgi:tetratricopeptide (TPR) repeat protein
LRDAITVTGPGDDDGAPLPAAERYGAYEVLGALGAGGMGIVLEARDPALQRRVALKVLKPHHALADGATRLVFEAQAMARLAHPNVVTVFEVGERDGRVWLAMELVRGTTLRGWLRAPRRWREIVEIFVAAGRGLAAAHDAGLVHRDFKPDNVLIGADGRPRVTDFGLVVEGAAIAEAVSELADGDSDATFRGCAAGTPAYMSAEQWSGRAVDARADQFAFCVALWEALCGERPFRGTKPQELHAAVQAGVIAPPRGPAPRWLIAIVRRGLARDPAARWPSMTALLDEIARRLRLRRARAIAAITAGVALAAAAVATIVTARDAIAPCAAPIARVAEVWGAAPRAAVHARLLAIDPVQGAVRDAKIAATLDAAARGWSAMHVEACRATREGRQSEALLDRRMECLDRWLGELDRTVRVVAESASVAEVDQAAHAATALTALDRCADARALGDAAPPAGLVDRLTAAALRAQIQEVEVAQRASRYDGLVARSAALVDAARALHHDPTLAAALAAEARVLVARKTVALAEPALRELVEVAARLRDDRAEAFAWMNLSPLPGQGAHIESARAAVIRAGSPLELEVDLLEREGANLNDSPRARDGLALLGQARQRLERAGAAQPGSPLAARLAQTVFETGQSHLVLEDYALAIASYREAIALQRAVFGADSLDEAKSAHHLALALQRLGKPDDAFAAAGEAVRIYQARLGASTAMVKSLSVQAGIRQDQGRWAEAAERYDRALAIDAATRLAQDPTRAGLLIGRSEGAAHAGKLADALRSLDEAIALFDGGLVEGSNRAIALFDRGDLLRRLGRCDDALRDFARSLAVFARWADPSSHYLLYPLTGQAMCLVETGHPADALPVLERALRLKVDVGDALQLARARATLGRARVETGRDVPGGLALARQARATIATLPDAADDLRALDRWLAAR